ncbi:MAG: AAA family ATPase, partial [Bryobacteraceae bacterium]
QLDRFLMRIRIGYPDPASEREVVRSGLNRSAVSVVPALTAEEVVELQAAVPDVKVEDVLVDYIMNVVEQTRRHESLSLGVSPRGAQALFRAAQALAMIEGRDYALPDDVKRLVVPVCAHRVVVNTRVALAQRSSESAERVLQEILTLVEVPL